MMVSFSQTTIFPLHRFLDTKICPNIFSQVLLLKMIYSQVSSTECNSANTNKTNMMASNFDCGFFLTAIRLASLNQILDPWVYLLLREILLRKFCIMANAVSNCSIEDQKGTQTALDTLNKQNKDDNICKSPSN